MKIWEKKEGSLDKVIKFTVGNDTNFDLLLAQFDVLASIAHAQMLYKCCLLQEKELTSIKNELQKIFSATQDGSFTIEDGIEDVHSQIEMLLTKAIGDAGKKIHTGRSRNDQVLVDLKLYFRDEIKQISDRMTKLFALLIDLSQKHKDVLLPGYTHLQVAMPSSFGLWFGAYAESLIDDLEVLLATYKVVNKNPLGSAAGYGSSFPLKRELTTELLGFDTLNYNVVYAQMTRGKTEKLLGSAIANIASTIAKMSMDLCLYLSQNFNFVSFPSELTTGSSIMPHKKNPDVFELIRGKCNRLQSIPNELILLTTNLPSGYHRELQLTKEIIFPAISELKSCLEMMHFMLEHIEVNKSILNEDKYKYLFTVEKVNELVQRGTPFRDAYKKVGIDVEEGRFEFNGKLEHSHEGSIGNLSNSNIVENYKVVLEAFRFEDVLQCEVELLKPNDL